MKRSAHMCSFSVLALLAAAIFAPLGARASTTSTAATPPAQAVRITPAVIDEKARAADIIKQSLALVNLQDRVLQLYPFIYNVESRDGKQEFLDPSQADPSTSLANWVSLDRGVIRLEPGEHWDVEFAIEINSRARPGTYHAMIAFADGATRDEAEKKIGEGQVMNLNVEILEDIKENLQLKAFAAARNVFWGGTASFRYELENVGNRALAPRGQVRIYDKNGKEVAAIEANREGSSITPQQVAQLSSLWDSIGGMGRYKAMLNLEYGETYPSRVQDTVFFWVLPWTQLALALAGIVGLAAGGTWLVHRRRNGEPLAVPILARRRSHHVVDLRPPSGYFKKKKRTW